MTHVPAPLPPAYDALVLAGGEARRLGGQDKPALLVGGRPLVARVVEAVADAERVVLVGPPRPGVRADVTVQEEPPGSGPVAAIAAGVAHSRAEVVVVLAADLPFLTQQAVQALRERLTEDADLDLVLATDDGGKDQLLLAAWRASALRAALAGLGPPGGVPVRRLVANTRVGRCVAPGSEGRPPVWFDCDTPADLDTAKGWQ